MESLTRSSSIQPLSDIPEEAFDFNMKTEFEDIDVKKSPSIINSNSKRICKKREKYQKIDDISRQNLIDDVTKRGIMLKAAAEKYNINYSSAKSIYLLYRREGRVIKKKLRERHQNSYVNIPAKVISPESTTSSNFSDENLKCNPELTAMAFSLLPNSYQESQNAKPIQYFNNSTGNLEPLKLAQMNVKSEFINNPCQYNTGNPYHANLRYHLALQRKLYQDYAKLQNVFCSTFSKMSSMPSNRESFLSTSYYMPQSQTQRLSNNFNSLKHNKTNFVNTLVLTQTQNQ